MFGKKQRSLEEDFAKLGLDPAFILGEMKHTNKGMEKASLYESEELASMNEFEVARGVASNTINAEDVDPSKQEKVKELATQFEMEKAFESVDPEDDLEESDVSWVNNKEYAKLFESAKKAILAHNLDSLTESYVGLHPRHQIALGNRFAKMHGQNAWANCYENIVRTVRQKGLKLYQPAKLTESQEALAQNIERLNSVSQLRSFAVQNNIPLQEGMEHPCEIKHAIRIAIKEGKLAPKPLTESTEVLEEGLKKKKLKRMKASERAAARRTYRKKKTKIKRRLKKLKAKPAYKRRKAKLKRLKKGRDAGARKKFVLEGMQMFQTQLTESEADIETNLNSFVSLVQEAKALTNMEDYIHQGEVLKPIDVDLDEEPIEAHMGDKTPDIDKEGTKLKKCGVDDKESHQHIGEDNNSHLYFYSEADTNLASDELETKGLKARKGDDHLIFSNDEDASKAKQIIREKQIPMDEDRELVRQFQKTVYSESLDLKLEAILEDSTTITDRLKKHVLTQSDANTLLSSMKKFFDGTMQKFHDVVSKSTLKYVGDDIASDDSKPVKAEDGAQIGEDDIEANSQEPVKAQDGQHQGKDIKAETAKPVKPDNKNVYADSKSKNLNKAQAPVKADNMQHTGEHAYQGKTKGETEEVLSGIKTESKEITEATQDLMDIAKKHFDDREDWVNATVASGISYAMGRANGETYNALRDMPELFNKAVQEVKTGQLKANPCEIADWLKSKVGNSGDEFQGTIEPMEPVEPTEPTEPIEPEVEESKKKINEEKETQLVTDASKIEFNFDDYKGFLAAHKLPETTEIESVKLVGQLKWAVDFDFGKDSFEGFSASVPNQNLKLEFTYYGATEADPSQTITQDIELKNVKAEVDVSAGGSGNKNFMRLNFRPTSILWSDNLSIVSFDRTVD